MVGDAEVHIATDQGYRQDNTTILDTRMPPQVLELSVDGELRGHGSGAFAYLDEIRHAFSQRAAVDVSAGRVTVVRLVIKHQFPYEPQESGAFPVSYRTAMLPGEVAAGSAHDVAIDAWLADVVGRSSGG